MTKVEDIICPVCGYYCLGKGGIGCIDKPFYLTTQEIQEDKNEDTKNKPYKISS